ncbi:MAG: hypothetical protein MJA83_05585 [Gammaproteobacteria bacterium]|nr:hypothetical protein [Gammaproteobacteria bacterium]
MRVMLRPVMNGLGQRKNNGPVTLIMERFPPKDGQKIGSPKRVVTVGHEPVNVDGCEDPMLKHFLTTTKASPATDGAPRLSKLVNADAFDQMTEALESAEEDKAMDASLAAQREQRVAVSLEEQGKGAQKAKGK